MNIEERLATLERKNRRLQQGLALLLPLAVAWPLLSAVSPHASREDVVSVRAADGSELRLEARKDQGLGLFLLDKEGKVRASMTLDGDMASVRVSDKKQSTAASLEAGAVGAALGLRQGEAWRMRDEVMNGVPSSSLYDNGGVERIRSGLFKDEPVISLRDPEGKDRAWMVVERGPHASVAVRGAGRSEVALHARANDPCGLGLRSADGKMKVGLIGDDSYGQAFFYGPDERARIVVEARDSRQAIEAIDGKNIKRLELGVVDGSSRFVQRNRANEIFEDRSEGPAEKVQKQGEETAPPTEGGAVEPGGRKG